MFTTRAERAIVDDIKLASMRRLDELRKHKKLINYHLYTTDSLKLRLDLDLDAKAGMR
jgi:hypothetical protein